MPDFDKPCRKYMEKKPVNKLRSRDCDESVPAGVVIVSGPEGDRFSADIGQSIIRDGDSVGVAAEVVVSFF